MVDDKNVVDKQLDNELEVQVTLLDDTSILTPTIIYGGSLGAILGTAGESQEHPLNYCYISRFDRYYYITDIRITASHLCEIDLKVDVLKSHLKKSISTTPLMATRWEGGRAAQEYVPEESLNLRTKNQLIVKSFGDEIIKPSFYFILNTAGVGKVVE